MWFDIIKVSPHKWNVTMNIVPDYLDSIDNTIEFFMSDIIDWAKKQTELYENSNGSEGKNYRTTKGTVDFGFPPTAAITMRMKETPFKNQMEHIVGTYPRKYRKTLVG
jgi:hypothetical protein